MLCAWMWQLKSSECSWDKVLYCWSAVCTERCEFINDIYIKFQLSYKLLISIIWIITMVSNENYVFFKLLILLNKHFRFLPCHPTTTMSTSTWWHTKGQTLFGPRYVFFYLILFYLLFILLTKQFLFRLLLCHPTDSNHPTTWHLQQQTWQHTKSQTWLDSYRLLLMMGWLREGSNDITGHRRCAMRHLGQ